MKFLDLINEDEQSEWNKLFKKTQLVFKTLRKGRIRTKSGVVFSYEIPEDSDISVASSRGEEPTPYVRCESIKIKEESKECSDISYSMFGELIKRKFGHFGILFVFSVYPEDIEKYEHKTINEDFQIEKKLKKAKHVFRGLHKGKMKLGGGDDPSIIYYDLVDPEYKIIDEHNNKDIIDKDVYIICKLVAHTNDELLVQTCSPNNLDDPALRINILKQIAENVVNKFYDGWNVILSIGISDIEVNYRPKEPQPINENDNDNEKLLKKARTVYKAYKHGKYKSDNEGQREDALFSYRLSDEPNIRYWKSLNNDTDVRIECEIFTKSLNEVADWTKTDRMIKHIENNFKNHDIDIHIKEWTYNMEPYTKPTEPINEDNNDIKVRLTKKANAVYSALKKGTIKYYLNGEENEPAIYTYNLSDGKRVVISGLDDIYIVPDEIKIREENRECSKISYGHVEKLLKQRFEGFNINLNVHNFYPGDVDTWSDREHPPFGWANNTHTINENDDKRIKRARTIYKALKKGLLVRGEYRSIKYLLPDEYKVYVRSIDDVLVIRVGEEEDDNHVKFFFNDDNGTGDRPTKPGPKY
jgi:hypothetical protein